MDTSCESGPYEPNLRYQIIAIYITCIVVWFVLVIALRMTASPAFLIVIIPFIVFALSILSGPEIDHGTRKHLFQTPIVTICILIAIQFVVWATQPKCEAGIRTLILITAAVSLALLSLIDIWSTTRHLAVWSHARHGLQTMAVATILYAMINFCSMKARGCI